MSTPAVTSLLTEKILSSLSVGNDAVRKRGRDALNQSGLPTNKHEEYRFTTLTRSLEKNFSTWSDPATHAVDTTTLPLAEADAYRIVMVNGHFQKQLSVLPQQAGLKVASLKDVPSDHLNTHLATLAEPESDPFVAWNTAAWTDGLYLKLEDKTILDKPVLVFHFVTGNDSPVILHQRNLFLVGKHCEATVVHVHQPDDHVTNFVSMVTEGRVDENSGLNVYELQNGNPYQHLHHHTRIQQNGHSRVNTYTFTLAGGVIRNNMQLVLDGEGCESHMYGLYLLDQQTQADNHTVVDHRKPNSFSNELYKGILNGKSKGVFNGKIFVRPHAQKTNAFQSNRNILLSPEATLNTKPQLEIWADDVKCSHGCTSGQLDEEALFYLQTRGIPKAKAQALLLSAFAGEVLDHVAITELKAYLEKLITQRLS